MAKGGLRRSERLGTYDSNGRDYLASCLGWSQWKLEEWLYSATVRSHLQQWYTTCIDSPKRFNDGVEWINTGAKGYFYNPTDLEEDILLMCLCAGKDGEAEEGFDFAEPSTNTENWNTQDLWARTAWRIVHANRSEGQVFYPLTHDRPAAAYGFAIELLCIAFHSIAFRGADSVYLELLKGGNSKAATNNNQHLTMSGPMILGTQHADAISGYTSTASSSDADRSSDATFAERKRKRKAPESERSTIIIVKRAKVEEGGIDDIGSVINVAPRKPKPASTAVSLEPADGSSVDEARKQEPLTPETNFNFRDRVDDEEVSKDERVQKWLERIGDGRAVMWQ